MDVWHDRKPTMKNIHGDEPDVLDLLRLIIEERGELSCRWHAHNMRMRNDLQLRRMRHVASTEVEK